MRSGPAAFVATSSPPFHCARGLPVRRPQEYRGGIGACSTSGATATDGTRRFRRGQGAKPRSVEVVSYECLSVRVGEECPKVGEGGFRWSPPFSLRYSEVTGSIVAMDAPQLRARVTLYIGPELRPRPGLD